jgi:hypothetical protein
MKSSAYLKWLKKWIDGSLTAREEQQLEQAARKDGFLRDALEGLRSQPGEEHELRLSRLRKKIQPSEKERPKGMIIPLALRRIAATALLVLALGSIWWLNRPATEQVSMTDPAEIERPVETEAEAIPKEEIQEAPPKPPTIETPQIAEKKQAPSTTSTPEPSTPTQTPQNYHFEEATIEQTEEAPPPAVADRPPRQVLPRTSPTIPQAEEAFPLESIRVRIIDPTGQPVAGAIILNQRGEQAAISDAAGNFKREPQYRLNNALSVRHSNYADTTLEISSPPAEQVVLTMRREAATMAKRSRREVDRQQPLPVGGFDYFRRDSEAYQAFFAGRQVAAYPTTVAFTVYPLGRIGDFEVLSTVSDAQANRVVAYLQQGPKWVLPGGLDSLRTQITIPVQE